MWGNHKPQSHGVIVCRDGKELDVDLTLLMAQDVIDNTHQTPVEKGLAMSLEAALVALKEDREAGR